MDKNEAIYRLSRVNILTAVKGSHFIDSPAQLVRRLDRLYVTHHSKDYHDFLYLLRMELESVKHDLDFPVLEYQRATQAVNDLICFLEGKLTNEEELENEN